MVGTGFAAPITGPHCHVFWSTLKRIIDVFGRRRPQHAPEKTSWISLARAEPSQCFGAGTRQPQTGTGTEPLIGPVLTRRVRCTEGESLGASGGATGHGVLG